MANKNNVKISDLVWAKMKGFPPWPGKVTAPPDGEAIKKQFHYVFFFGTYNYAWVHKKFVFPYEDYHDCFNKNLKYRGFHTAVEEIKERHSNRRKIPDSEEDASPSDYSDSEEDIPLNLLMRNIAKTKRSKSRKTKSSDSSSSDEDTPLIFLKNKLQSKKKRVKKYSQQKVNGFILCPSVSVHDSEGIKKLITKEVVIRLHQKEVFQYIKGIM